jgi:hypothetical protein
MSVSADTYIVISLMFAVFAAVAAVGTSLVLGVGFERLRMGFEVVRRQSGFFADAIHKLDQRTAILDERTGEIKTTISALDHKIDRVEKETTFLADAINGLQMPLAVQAERPKDDNPFSAPVLPENFESSMEEPEDYYADSLLQAPEVTTTIPEQIAAPLPAQDIHKSGLSNLLVSYLVSEARPVIH